MENKNLKYEKRVLKGKVKTGMSEIFRKHNLNEFDERVWMMMFVEAKTPEELAEIFKTPLQKIEKSIKKLKKVKYINEVKK